MYLMKRNTVCEMVQDFESVKAVPFQCCLLVLLFQFLFDCFHDLMKSKGASISHIIASHAEVPTVKHMDVSALFLISALGAMFTSQLSVISYATMNILLILKQQCGLEESMHKGVN